MMNQPTLVFHDRVQRNIPVDHGMIYFTLNPTGKKYPQLYKYLHKDHH